MFVPEAHHVSQLVDHDPELVAVLPDGDCLDVVLRVVLSNCEPYLGTISSLPNEAAAPTGSLSEHLKLLELFCTQK